MNNKEKLNPPLIFYSPASEATKLEQRNDYIPELQRRVVDYRQKDGRYIYYETVKKSVDANGKSLVATRKLPGTYDVPLAENPDFELRPIPVAANSSETRQAYFRKLPDSVTDLDK